MAFWALFDARRRLAVTQKSSIEYLRPLPTTVAVEVCGKVVDGDGSAQDGKQGAKKAKGEVITVATRIVDADKPDVVFSRGVFVYRTVSAARLKAGGVPISDELVAITTPAKL